MQIKLASIDCFSLIQVSGLLVKMKRLIAMETKSSVTLSITINQIHIDMATFCSCYTVYSLNTFNIDLSVLTAKSLFTFPLDLVKEEEEVLDPNTVVYKSGHNKTVITYKKDFDPYTTRIYNFIKSFSDEPGSGDSDK